MPAPPAIRARALSRSFPAPNRFGLPLGRRSVVEDVDLEADSGEVLALVGRNQAGKTTLLRLLAGLLRPDRGAALLGGRPATEAGARRGLGYLGEESPLPRGLRPMEAVRLASRLAGAGPEEAALAAEAVGLPDRLRQPLARCSRGVRQRAGLAAALVGRPRALILDEPLTGLDPVGWDLAVRAIRKAAEAGAAVILSLHSQRGAELLADRVVVLRAGRVARQGPLGNFAGAADWLLAAVRG